VPFSFCIYGECCRMFLLRFLKCIVFLMCCLWFLWGVLFGFFFYLVFLYKFSSKIPDVAWLNVGVGASPLSKGTSFELPYKNRLLYLIANHVYLSFTLDIKRSMGSLRVNFFILCWPSLPWCTRCFLLHA